MQTTDPTVACQLLHYWTESLGMPSHTLTVYQGPMLTPPQIPTIIKIRNCACQNCPMTAASCRPNARIRRRAFGELNVRSFNQHQGTGTEG